MKIIVKFMRADGKLISTTNNLTDVRNGDTYFDFIHPIVCDKGYRPVAISIINESKEIVFTERLYLNPEKLYNTSFFIYGITFCGKNNPYTEVIFTSVKNPYNKAILPNCFKKRKMKDPISNRLIDDYTEIVDGIKNENESYGSISSELPLFVRRILT